MYDNTCKYLAETYPADFAIWLLGEPIALTRLEPRELSTEPIRADSLTFLESQDVILHLEFQTRPDDTIPFRMADYYLRLYSRPKSIMNRWLAPPFPRRVRGDNPWIAFTTHLGLLYIENIPSAGFGNL
jgi:predicted transposase/invertase (TIGR01784 family)